MIIIISFLKKCPYFRIKFLIEKILLCVCQYIFSKEVDCKHCYYYDNKKANKNFCVYYYNNRENIFK